MIDADSRLAEALHEAIETQTQTSCPLPFETIEAVASLMGDDISTDSLDAALEEIAGSHHAIDPESFDFIVSQVNDELAGYPD